ncbi:MAG: hypothetical protein V1663_05180 [archaeon]
MTFEFIFGTGSKSSFFIISNVFTSKKYGTIIDSKPLFKKFSDTVKIHSLKLDFINLFIKGSEIE